MQDIFKEQIPLFGIEEKGGSLNLLNWTASWGHEGVSVFEHEEEQRKERASVVSKWDFMGFLKSGVFGRFN